VSRTVNHRINTQNIPDKYVKEEGIVRDFLKRVQAVTWNRRFLETSDGLVGIAPGQTEKGDKVCILYGCSVPVILRKKGRFYEYIGEAYIYGKMDGEAIVAHEDQGRTKPDTFALR
jgi:hypothetical protein